MSPTILKQIHTELSKGWTYLRGVNKLLDQAEKRVAAAEALKPQHGRLTPYFVQKTLQFAPFDMTPKQMVLVPDALCTLKLTELTYAVTYDATQTILESTGPGLRPRQKTLFYESAAAEVELFDFEWNMLVGPSFYGSARGGRNWLSRKSLGSPDTRGKLLFSDKNPIVLRRGDRLEFNARATHFNLDPDRAYTSAERFYLHIIGTGFRVYGEQGADA